jgi:restriction system protein
MVKRKKNPRLLTTLIAAPWWTSLLLGLAVWLILFGIIPTAISNNPYLDVLAALSRSAAWLALLFFVLLATVSFVRAKKAAQKEAPLDVSEEPLFKKANKRSAIQPIVIDQDMHTVLALAGNTSESDAHWTIESLYSLEWKRFELLCAKYYEALGFKAETLAAGADGGVDIRLFRLGMDAPIAIVQCKSWKSQVTVSEIRELFGVMAHEKVARGIFITTGSYTRDALMFGAANPIQLLDGVAFLKKILELEPASRNALKAFAFSGDYTTPTCASCGIKLVRRESRRSAFWGCVNYPRCHMTLKIRVADLA